MSTTLPKDSKAPFKQAQHDEARIEAERIKNRARARKVRAAQKIAGRVRIELDGSKTFLRFNRAQRFQHQLLIGTFTSLAVTGLLQRYSDLTAVGWVINTVLGGVETLRTLHHLTAVVFIFQAIYHTFEILTTWFIDRERGSMWPQIQDLRDLIQMVKYNLGLAAERPRFGRFSIEEKVEYWALVWGSVIMILTGIIQWFPAWITWVLPGQAVPISRSIHGWEAVLATLSILIWHTYHVVIKEKNESIFTGVMSEKEMMETHLAEYEHIMAARKFLQMVSKNQDGWTGKKVNSLP